MNGGGGGMHIGYCWEIQMERDHCEAQGIGGWTILNWILERWGGMVWIGLNWIRLSASGRLD
jgi:hypothetical protein